MDNLTPWKIIKIGFLLGIGFIIPSLFVNVAVIGFSFGAVSSSFEDFETEIDTNDDESYFYSYDNDYTDAVDIGEYRSQMQGVQLLIQGAMTNNADVELNSVEIEAELFDANGVFVYECSDYINVKLAPDQTENYQIKCGCSKNGLPEYDSIKLRVTRASSY